MTVGTVILTGDADPLADAVGRPAVRRVIDSAWAGGAMPIVVVAPDASSVEGAISGSPARLSESGLTGSAALAVGAELAGEVVVETAALLIWPMSMAWVDPETITSLIEASGRHPGRVVRPLYKEERGWPILVPTDLLAETTAAPGTLDELVARFDDVVEVDLGDPGSVTGIEVALDDLPTYSGPPEPVGGPPPEWGAEAAETPD